MKSLSTLALLASLLIILTASNVYAQQYRFNNISVEGGLSQSQVLTVHQDELGEIWIGTASGGISVFDGLDFHYISQKDGIPSNTIYDISSLGDGNIAVSTFEGVAVVSHDTIFSYSSKEGLPESLSYCTLKSSDGRIWIGTANGICFLNNGKIEVPKDHLLDGRAVFKIQETSNGEMWFSTIGDGAYRLKNGEFQHFGMDEGLPGVNVNGVFSRGDSTLIFTFDGIAVLAGDSIHQFNPNHPLSKDLVFSCMEDSRGELWFATKQGLYLWGKNSRYYTLEDGISGKVMCCLLEDREGNIWAGSRDKGVSRISRKMFENLDVSNGLPDNSINRILSMPDSSVWIASDRGVTVHHPDGRLENIGKRYALQTRTIRCMYDDGEGTVYMGTEMGVYSFSQDKLKKIYNPSGTTYFVQDISSWNDTVFAATNEGMAYIKGSRLIRYALSGLPNVVINQFLVDKNGKLWIGTNEQGLWRVDNNKAVRITEAEGLKAKTVKALMSDRQGRVWCASNSGLYIYDKGRFSSISTEDGLSSNSAVSIIQLNDTTFWTGLNKGANRFVYYDNKVQSIDVFGVEDGFNGQESNPRAIQIDYTGRIWFGTNGGVNIFNPENDVRNQMPPITRISGVKLFMQEVDWSDFSVEIDENGLPIDLELDYDKNNLSFQFKGVSHVNPDLIKYKYRLLGESQDWIETQERKAGYSNLEHGKYTFEVIACNSDGAWNSIPVTFSFVILPPFWKTWWFYGICFLIVAAAIFSYFKIRTANTKITQINELLTEQKDIISRKNKDIMDSIHYAKRIQDAVLPAAEEIDLPHTFVFNRPKDVVSGDFYWFYNKGNLSLFAVADCTGHGVPGAFMSIIGHNNLNKIVGEQGIYEPALILEKLNAEISSTLNRRPEDGPVRDGLDISLCCFHRDTEIMEFAGAFHPFLLWRMGELQVIKGDRVPIGSGNIGKKYTNHSIQLLKGDMIYLHTDGIVDQFGGEKGKKYKSVRLRKFLIKIGKMPISEQRNALIREFETWKIDQEQVDDVLVLGTRL